MEIRIQSIHFDADQKLIDFIEKRVGKLESFNSRIINGEVYLRLNNSSDRENKLVEIKLFVPGRTLFSKDQGKTFEEATDSAVDSLRRQIQKNKDKKSAV